MPTETSPKSLAAQIAAHESWAHTTDRPARTAPARAALDARFLREADGDPIRADHLRRAYFLRLSLKSAKARRARAVVADGEAAEAELAALGEGEAAR